MSGVNDRHQLADAEAVMRQRVNRAHMAHVTFRDPATTEVQPDVRIDVDVELGRFVALRGRTTVGHGARIGDGAILTDVEVGPGAVVQPYTVAADVVIGPHATVGPFVHLRDTTVPAAAQAAPSGVPLVSKNGFPPRGAKKYAAARKSG